MCLQLGLGMNSNEGVLISVANLEVGTSITANVDLLPSAPASFLLARNDVTVGATGHASVQGHIQVPEGLDKAKYMLVLKPSQLVMKLVICQYELEYLANKNPYQSSLLKTMKPRLPRPKATWLL